MIPNFPTDVCNHRDIYYSAEHDNFYCGHCHQSMGIQFYKLMEILKNYLKFKPMEGSKDRHKAYDEALKAINLGDYPLTTRI